VRLSTKLRLSVLSFLLMSVCLQSSARLEANGGSSVYLPYIAQPALVYVANTSIYTDPYDNLVIVGEVINNSGSVIYSPQVQVSLIFSNGMSQVTTGGAAMLPSVPNGEKSPFSYGWALYNEPSLGSWSSYSAVVTNYWTTPTFPGCTYTYAVQFSGPNVAPSTGGWTPYGGAFTYAGTVPTLQYFQVVMTAYDRQGSVVFAQNEGIGLSGPRQPGDTESYGFNVPTTLVPSIASTALVGYAVVSCPY
jgi:hypothetical protein